VKDVSPVRIYIKLVRDRPKDLILVTLGAQSDATPGVGSTVVEAIRNLADHLEHDGAVRFDDDLRKLLFRQEGPC